MKKIFLPFSFLLLLSAILFVNFSLAREFYSNILEVTTQSISSNPAPRVYFRGTPYGGTIIKLEVYAENVSSLNSYIDLVSPSSRRLISEPRAVSYSYNHTGLTPNTTYTYSLTATFPDGTTYRTVTSTISVETITSDSPTRMQAFANSNSSIYINWKDNVTSTAGSYNFVVERMKLTPEPAVNHSSTVSTGVNGINPELISVILGWKNYTSSTPYYDLIERSTSSAFLSNNNYYSPSLGGVPYSTFTGDSYNNNWGRTNPVQSIYEDRNLSELTTYYYRIRECSLVDVRGYYTRETPSTELNIGETGKPIPPCSEPTPRIALSVFTPPYAPYNLTATSSGNTVTLHWDNLSRGASGIAIYRIDGNSSSSNLIQNVSSNAVSYTDSVTSGNTYTYYLKSYYVDSGGVTHYSKESNRYSVTIAYGGNYKLASAGILGRGILPKFSLNREKLGETILNFEKAAISFYEKIKPNLAKIAGLFENNIFSRKTEAQSTSETYDNYFKPAGITEKPYFRDDNLLPDTVYAYRVKVRYNGGSESNWSNYAAAKTLPDIGLPLSGDFARICIANSVCNTNIPKYSSSRNDQRRPTTEYSESQCRVNADCANVGRVGQTIRER